MYWVDFKIDPSSFEINTVTHTTQSNSSTNIAAVQTNLKGLLKVDATTITEYKKVGFESEENIELSLQLVQRWFSEIWTQEVSDEFKIRATFSVKDRDGHFDLKSRKWEDTNIFFGKPLE